MGLGYGFQRGKKKGRFYYGGSLDVSAGMYFSPNALYLNAELMLPKLVVKIGDSYTISGGVAVGLNVNYVNNREKLIYPYVGFSLGFGF